MRVFENLKHCVLLYYITLEADWNHSARSEYSGRRMERSPEKRRIEQC